MSKADDIEWGAFTDDGPWVLDRDNLLWYPIAGLLRQAASADVPALTRPRRLPPGLRVITVAGRLIGAIGPWWLRKKLGRYSSPEASRADISARLRRAVERLGPTYIKLGQIISSGEGLFPAEL
ncbi:MAG: ubiquinone biosynthesis protein, partial [Ilumatobacteraceae bacterium]|nr:ubiquinone biosynthesis protein [Ilumatobacteraceae bacterium]